MTADSEALAPFSVAGTYDQAAERITLPHSDSTDVLAQPDAVAKLWVEDEYEQLEAEQPPLWEATGMEVARASDVEREKLALAAETATKLAHGNLDLVAEARTRLQKTLELLTPYRRRAVGTKKWYLLAKAGFLLGDIAGFGTAAIWLGELVAIAITLAVSAAVATVAAGLIGTEIGDHRRRLLRSRTDESSPAAGRFPELFTREDPGFSTVKVVVYVSLLVGGLIGASIGTLRGVVDDPLVGIVFGGIAAAVAGGCFLVSYAGADQVADLIDHAQTDYELELTRQTRLAEAAPWQAHAAAKQTSTSLIAEHQKRGEAASTHLRALKWGILRRNPRHAGHGRPADQIGRTPRKAV